MNRRSNRITRIVSARPAGLTHQRRLIAVRVLDITGELVSHAARHEWRPVAQLMLERRRLLERIPQDPRPGGERECVEALRAAMDESDRTIGLLLAGAELNWPYSGPLGSG